MAMTYQNFASLGVNLNRQKYGPLDISNVFTSAADLKYYLTKGTFTEGVSEYWYKNANEKVVPYPYEGQVLATVIDGVVSVYALSIDAEGNFQTQEIGAKIETDDKTIKLVDGKLELVGLDNVETGKTYVPSLVNGVLTWAEPDTSTAEGQAQEINALKLRAEALEAAVNGTEASEGVEAKEGLVDKVAANAQAIADEASARDAADKVLEGKIADALQAAKDYADENDANTVYDDTALAGRVSTIEADYLKTADKYDDTALAGRVTAVEGKVTTLEEVVGSAEAGLVKDVADNAKAISAMDAAYKAADAQVLVDAKAYTDAEIDGLSVSIEQKDGVEHIVVKDKDGNEITSANASKFVQDSFLDDVVYDHATGKVTFTWKMGDGSTKTDEIDIAALVDTYTAGNGLVVENNEFAIDTEVVATVSALNAVSEVANAAQTAEQVGAAIDAKIAAENLSQYAKSADVEAALADKVDTDAYAEDKATFAIKSEVASTLEGYYTKTEVDNYGFAIETEVASTYATKAELESHEEEIANDLLAYAKTADVNTALDAKVASGTIAHTTDEIAEGVTVNGTVMNIVVDAFTKAETRKYVADTISQMTGGESAADVLLALNNYKSDNDARVGAIETKNGEQDTAILAAQAQADKGVADAKTANDAVAALASGAVADNTREIGVAKSSIQTVNETLTEKITALEGKDTEFTTAITALETLVNGHTTTITEQGAAIVTLQNKDTELATLIQANTDKFANYYTKDEVDTAVQGAIDAIPEVDFTPYAKTEDVNAALALKANAADVYTKTEADAAFMNESEVDARINALIVAADPEGGKTITDIQNLVKYVDENAGEIASLVTAVGANTAKLVGIDSTVTDYVAAQIATVVTPKASAEVTVADDGTLGLGEVSTDKLVQGTKTLVLFGGDAEVAAAE